MKYRMDQLNSLAIVIWFLLVSSVHGANYGGITSSVASPGVGGSAVTFTATATGGSGQYEYKFWRLPITDGYQGLWSTVRDWSTDPTYRLNVPSSGGQQWIGVWMRDLGSSATYEGNGSIFWEALPAQAGEPGCGPLSLSALGATMSNLDGQHYLPLANKAYTMGSYSFPFTVPVGKTFEIGSVNFFGKDVLEADGMVRGAGVILTNLFTVTNNTPLVFPIPLQIPSGYTIDGLFSNNTTSEPMNVMVLIVGKLTGADCPN